VALICNSIILSKISAYIAKPSIQGYWVWCISLLVILHMLNR